MHPLAGSADPIRTVAGHLAAVRVPTTGGGQARLGDLRDATSLRFSAR